MRVRFSPKAAQDAEDIRAYIACDRPVAAADIFDRLFAACYSLADFPHSGRPARRSRLRELTTVKPYIITYVVDGEIVRILRITHGARLR